MKEVIERFKEEVNEIYKSYRLQHFSLKIMSDVYSKYKDQSPEINNFKIEDRDLKETISYSEENILTEISEYGKYQRMLAEATIVMFYQLWEDLYRVEIADILQTQKGDIKSELFFEINKIRRAIIHNQSKSNECKNLQIINFLKVDESELQISSLEVSKIFHLINEEIDRLALIERYV